MLFVNPFNFTDTNVGGTMTAVEEGHSGFFANYRRFSHTEFTLQFTVKGILS